MKSPLDKLEKSLTIVPLKILWDPLEVFLCSIPMHVASLCMDKLMLPIWYKTWPSVKNEEITENWTKRIHELDVQPVSSTNKSPSGHLAKYKQSYLSSDLVNLTLYGTKAIIWLSPVNIVSFILGVMIGSFKV